MHRIFLATLIGTVAAGTVAAGHAPGLFVEGRADAKASTAPTLDARARDAIDAATAAALIGALQSRFEGERVELRLGEVKADRVSLRDLALHGDARIRFAGAQAWMPIRFDALYDTTGMVVESPNIVIGARTADAKLADALPLPGLVRALDAALDAEFQSNAVDVSLGKAQVIGSDGRRDIVAADVAVEDRDRVRCDDVATSIAADAVAIFDGTTAYRSASVRCTTARQAVGSPPATTSTWWPVRERPWPRARIGGWPPPDPRPPAATC